MPTHSMEGPGQPGESFVTTVVAARWLGVSDSTFLRLIGRKKGGAALPGVAEWMRPMGHGNETLWAVEDVIVLRHILRQRGGAPPEESEEEKI